MNILNMKNKQQQLNGIQNKKKVMIYTTIKSFYL